MPASSRAGREGVDGSYRIDIVTLLQLEQETFEARRAELVAESAGKFALIHGDELVAVLETKADAISSGYERYGNAPFLVKEIAAIEAPHNFVSRLLAV
jgi:hypothetical protein